MKVQRYHPVVELPSGAKVFDFTRGSINEGMASEEFGIGRYGEDRKNVYEELSTHSGRTVHMGVDLFGPAGTPVHAFTSGIVSCIADNSNIGDYGPTIIIAHELEDGAKIFALYGHLGRTCLASMKPGESVKLGQEIAKIGDESVNGGWPPHVHFQLSTQMPLVCDMPGVVAPADFAEASKIYLDPRIVLGSIY